MSNEIVLTAAEYARFSDGDKVIFRKGDSAVIGGLSDDSIYYIRKTTSNRIKLFDTRAESIETGSSDGLREISDVGSANQSLFRGPRLALWPAILTQHPYINLQLCRRHHPR